VTAAEFVRNFARLREEARAQPLFITNHGRETHVLCDIETFRALEARMAPGAGPSPSQADEYMAFGLADWIDEGIIAFDDELTIVFANRVAHALVRAAPGSLTGKSINQALPPIRGSLIEMHVRQTKRKGEPNMADIPSPFAENAWLRFQSFPLNDRVVLRLKDVSSDVHEQFKANVQNAIARGIAAHDAISCVRISPRGTIDHADESFCELLNLPQSRLGGVLINDLVAITDRHRFRESLEETLRGQGSRTLDLALMSNRGETVNICMSIMQLEGIYSCEGAVLILTLLGGQTSERGVASA
jgi:PAS domain-containing protein